MSNSALDSLIAKFSSWTPGSGYNSSIAAWQPANMSDPSASYFGFGSKPVYWQNASESGSDGQIGPVVNTSSGNDGSLPSSSSSAPGSGGSVGGSSSPTLGGGGILDYLSGSGGMPSSGSLSGSSGLSLGSLGLGNSSNSDTDVGSLGSTVNSSTASLIGGLLGSAVAGPLGGILGSLAGKAVTGNTNLQNGVASTANQGAMGSGLDFSNVPSGTPFDMSGGSVDTSPDDIDAGGGWSPSSGGSGSGSSGSSGGSSGGGPSISDGGFGLELAGATNGGMGHHYEMENTPTSSKASGGLITGAEKSSGGSLFGKFMNGPMQSDPRTAKLCAEMKQAMDAVGDVAKGPQAAKVRSYFATNYVKPIEAAIKAHEPEKAMAGCVAMLNEARQMVARSGK